MSDQDTIQNALSDMIREAGRLPAYTVLCNLVTEYLTHYTANPTIEDAIQDITLIKTCALRIADAPEKWTHDGRFSATKFTPAFVLNLPIREQGIDSLIGVTLGKMDEAYAENFSIDGAVRMLRQLAKSADMLIAELRKEEPHK